MIKNIFDSGVVSSLIASIIYGLFSHITLSFSYLLIGSLILLSLYLYLKNVRSKNLLQHINILGKEYYDIFEDVIFYRRGSIRNKLHIENLKWEFIYQYNQNSNTFLDLNAHWVVDFKGKRPVKEIRLGLKGGILWKDDYVQLLTASQNGTRIFPRFEAIQDDYGTVILPLSSHIAANASGSIDVKYQSKRFIDIDSNSNDDYVYLFPRSQALSVDSLYLEVEHPYECTTRIFYLKQNWLTHTYHQEELRESPELKKKYSWYCNPLTPSSKQTIHIYGIRPHDIVIIIFEKHMGPDC